MARIPSRLEVQESLLIELNTQTAITPKAVEYERDTTTGEYSIKEVRLTWDHFVHLVAGTIK